MTARQGFSCAEVERFVDAYLDNEFSDGDRADIERHFAECPDCAGRARYQAAFKQMLRRSMGRPPAPASLRRRVEASLDAERVAPPSWWRVFATAIPAALAAGIAFMTMSPPPAGRYSPVVADAISWNRRTLPVEVTGNADTVRAWFHDKVDFAVRPPRMPTAALVGGRLANIRDHQAAYLVYNVSGAKVSVFVFEPGGLQIQSRRRRAVGNQEVYLDGDRGYHVALFRDAAGMGYAFASDLDEDQMLQLVSSAVEH